MEKEELIKKWLNENLNGEELGEFEALENSSFYRGIVENAQSFKAPEFNPTQTPQELIDSIRPVKDNERKLGWFYQVMKMAGVAALLAGFYFIFLSNSSVKIETQVAETKTIELPDGSSATLNAVSSLTYDPVKWESNRELTLDGEALFKVIPGSDFVVNTANGSVAVVGTVFNVKTRSKTLNVACFEGIVRVTSGKNAKTLKAGETYYVVEGNAISGTVERKKPDWMRGLSRFSHVSVGEVLEELERHYNVKITSSNVDLSKKFTGAFGHANLDSALTSITKPLNLFFEKKNDHTIKVTNRKN